MAERPLVEHIDAAGGQVNFIEGNVDAVQAAAAQSLSFHVAGNVRVTLGAGRQLERLFATVPAPGPTLVGREHVLTEARIRLMQGSRLAISALQGMPGVGKTALALELAYDEAVLTHFEGGVLWAGLGPQPDVDALLNRWG